MLKSIAASRAAYASAPSSIICRFASSSSSTSTIPSAPSSSTTDASASTTHHASSSTSPRPRLTLPDPPPRRPRPVRRALFTLGWLPVALFITSHLYSLGNVTGGSMSPTFNPASSSSRSDLVLLNRTVTYQPGELGVGDVVTLVSPLDPRLLLTKRIIGLPGDSVRVWVPGGRWRRVQVPPGHVWVEGDAAVDVVPGSLERVVNGAQAPKGWRNKSRDSREFGPVPMGLITSRIEAVVWPPERWGRPAPRPEGRREQASGKYPPSSNDRMTQVNPSLARVLDEMTLMDKQGRGRKAHPQDSVISPYVDWDDPSAKDEEDTGREKEEREDGRRRKHAWNQSSRGGRLGDDAD